MYFECAFWVNTHILLFKKYLFIIWLCLVLVVTHRIFVALFWIFHCRTGSVALRNVGSYFPDQGLNLCPLHCKPDC